MKRQSKNCLNQSVGSTRSTWETDTPTHTTNNQLSAAGNSDISDLHAIPEPKDENVSGHDVRLPYTGIFAIRGRSNVLSVFISSKMEQNIFCEIDKGAARLFDGRLQLAEETF